MKMPDIVRKFLTEKQWRKLRVEELPKICRDSVLRIITETLEEAEKEGHSEEDIEEFVEFTQDLVDDLRGMEPSPKLTEGELIAAEQTSDEVIRELKREAAAAKGPGGKSQITKPESHRNLKSQISKKAGVGRGRRRGGKP